MSLSATLILLCACSSIMMGGLASSHRGTGPFLVCLPLVVCRRSQPRDNAENRARRGAAHKYRQDTERRERESNHPPAKQTNVCTKNKCRAPSFVDLFVAMNAYHKKACRRARSASQCTTCLYTADCCLAYFLVLPFRATQS